MLKAVIFDCDGVLVDSEPLTNAIIQRNLAARGLEMTQHEVEENFVGGTIQGVGEKAAAMGARIEEGWRDALYEEIFEALAQQVELIPGVAEMLDWCAGQGLEMAIGSNGPRRKMEITLGRTGLLDRFVGRIVSRQDVAAPKPAPDVYLAALALTGVAAHEAVVIEDSRTGIKAAQAAGIAALAYAPHGKDMGAQGFASMSELPALLTEAPFLRAGQTI
ncbi:HAD family hydrolase [Pontivivens insulae]|uniref:Phosphorylated carbohydrates phosphatase n=1 Tax=Pontivivens insulae TaxID=1639689 RepID=A0A2R8ABW2_9RHOB|nr:HAD family phosphatase [Pontivivens insulae]RED11082.1 HAD superfamily hydrolase (TIGR01509 family) [Pontivivens insulae]SPF29743.1 Phosphorylated carbohydrates phosphatase [Pontivivens insulae]